MMRARHHVQPSIQLSHAGEHLPLIRTSHAVTVDTILSATSLEQFDSAALFFSNVTFQSQVESALLLCCARG